MNKKFSSLIIVGTTLVFISTAAAASLSNTCNGTVNFSIIYADGKVENVSVNGVDAMDSDVNTPITLQGLHFKEDGSFAGENGIEIGRHHIQLIPGGRSGGYYVKLFNYTTETWSTIDVYCPPLGLRYRQEVDEVVGFCAVNATYGPITCVPYFTLRLRNSQWVDVSRPGSCSQALSTVNITNPVILQSDSDYEIDDTRLYFGERGSNRLHEVRLGIAGEALIHETGATLKIDHLVPVSNASFLGLRMVCRVENSFDFYHKLYYVWQLDSSQQQQQTGFMDESLVTTESIAFDSYNLDYLVTFNAIRDTVKFEGERSNNFPSLSIPVLDDPIQCQNLVGPSTHFLICLTENEGLTVLINITDDSVTYQTMESKSKVIRIGVLTENTIYLLNDQQKLSVYLITSTVICLGTYGVRANIDFVITTASNNINCTDIENTSNINNSSSDSDTTIHIVVAVMVPIFIAIIIGIAIFVIRKWRKRRPRPAFNTKAENANDPENKGMPKDIGNDHLPNHNDAILKEHTPINHNGNIPMEEMMHPASPDDRDTRARNVEDPPTNSVDPCQEIGAKDQYTAMVNSACKGFPNPDMPGKSQNEDNGDETQCIEQSSERCIEPRECTERDEEILPPREEPVGHTCI